MPRLIYDANYLIEANKTNIVPQVVGMVEISSGGFAPGTVTAHATFPLPAPYNYDGRLRDVSSIDCSLNGAFGRVSFAVTNADLGEVSNVATDKYVGWECKVHKIIILEDGTLLGILLLHGVITSYIMTDRVVDMDVVTRINVGNTITPRRVNVKCPWVFKGTECGYSGVETVCNKLYSDAGGCSGRSNQHRFGGFPLRDSAASIGIVSGQGAGPTYQLIRDDSAFQFQRAILEFDNTFSVTDDPTNNKTVVSVTGGGGGGSGVTDGDKGDITVTNAGTVSENWSIDNNVVTFAKMQDIATSKLIGRTTAGSGDPEEIGIGSGLSLSALTLSLSGGITSSGLTVGALRLLGRITSGTGAIESIQLGTGLAFTSGFVNVSGAIISSGLTQATSRILGRTTAGSGAVEELTVGTGLSLSGGSLSNSGVTSVALTAPSFLTVSGSPVTTTGTLTLTLATQSANTVFAGPTTGSAAQPTFRALVSGDIPDLSSIYQPLDADLTAIAALTGDGLLRKTAGTWAMDSAVYLTANQTITLSGDVTGSGATSISTTIANNAVTTAKIGNDQVTFDKTQNIDSMRVLGRTTASAGNIEQLTVGQGLVLANGELRGGREVLTADRTYFVGFDIGAVTANATTDKIEKTAHGLENGDPVVFSAFTSPTGLTMGVPYYVINKTANDFEIEATIGGGKVLWSTNGTAVICRTGNDNNTGIGTNGRSVALLTVQKAIDLAGAIDPAIYKVTIKCAQGLYVDPMTLIALKLIKRLDIIGDDRSLAGLTYYNGAPIQDNAAVVMNSRAGVGNASISWTTGGTVLTITGATTNPTISADGWGAGDKVILFVPGGSTESGTFYDYQVASTAATTITITGATLPTASNSTGVCVMLVPYCALKTNNNAGRTVGGDFYQYDTIGVLLRGWHLQASDQFSYIVRLEQNSFFSTGWDLFDYRGVTAMTGISLANGKCTSFGLDALGHTPTSHIGGTNTFAVIAQGDSSVVARAVRFANVRNPVTCVDRSFVDCLNYRIVNATTGLNASRGGYIYALSGTFTAGTTQSSPAGNTQGTTMNFVQLT